MRKDYVVVVVVVVLLEGLFSVPGYVGSAMS